MEGDTPLFLSFLPLFGGGRTLTRLLFPKAYSSTTRAPPFPLPFFLFSPSFSPKRKGEEEGRFSLSWRKEEKGGGFQGKEALAGISRSGVLRGLLFFRVILPPPPLPHGSIGASAPPCELMMGQRQRSLASILLSLSRNRV